MFDSLSKGLRHEQGNVREPIMATSKVSPEVMSGVKSVMKSLRNVSGTDFVESARKQFVTALQSVPSSHRRNVKRKIARDFARILE